MRIIGKIVKWFLYVSGTLLGMLAAIVLGLWLVVQITTVRGPEWNYQRTEQGNAMLMAYKGNAEVLEIPAEIDGRPVTQLTVAGMKMETVREVKIPASLELISAFAFIDCPQLEAIRVAEDSLAFSSVDGMLCDGAGQALVLIPAAWTECVAPAGLTAIQPYCGALNDKLQRVELPEGLTTIGKSAFFYCADLEEANIPASVTSIGEDVFVDCPKLTLTVVPGTEGEAYAIRCGIPFRCAE